MDDGPNANRERMREEMIRQIGPPGVRAPRSHNVEPPDAAVDAADTGESDRIDPRAAYPLREAAMRAGVSYRTLAAAVRAGRLPTLPTARGRQVDGEALLAWRRGAFEPSTRRGRGTDRGRIVELLPLLSAAQVSELRAIAERMIGGDVEIGS